jgi:uncharacterized protein involved in exopolysaccharide biosynthesis
MTVQDLIAKLAARGITATEQQIDELFGSVEYLTDDDVPGIAEMLTAPPHDPHAVSKSKRKSTGKLAKPGRSTSIQKADSPAPKSTESTSIQKIDADNLPQVSSLSTEQVNGYITQLETMRANDEQMSSGLVQFLIDLYQKRDQAIQFSRSAVARLKQQDAELAGVMADLNTQIGSSVQGLQDANNLLNEISKGGARLGDSFRDSTAKQRTIFDSFFTKLDSIDGSGVQDTAA